jgi:hypothetical protein
MLLAARAGSRDVVLRLLMYTIWRRGGIGLVGRLEPKFLTSLGAHDCLIKPGDWAFMDARDQTLVHLLNSGEAFFSPLEGDLWLRSPMDRL